MDLVPINSLLRDLGLYRDFNPSLRSYVSVHRNFCVDIVHLEHLISISNVGTIKFENPCLISQLNLSLQDETIAGNQRRIKLIRRSPSDGDQSEDLRQMEINPQILRLTSQPGLTSC